MSCTFVALDFETANWNQGSACAVGMVRVEDGQIVAAERRLINPQTWFWDRFIGVHGITAETVKDAPLFPQAWHELALLLDRAEFIAAHNASFDKDVLRRCCQRHGITMPGQEFRCTMQLARRLWRLDAYTLADVCRHLNIELNHHEPLSDATACAHIVLHALHAGHKI